MQKSGGEGNGGDSEREAALVCFRKIHAYACTIYTCVMTDPLWMPRSGEGMSREAGIGQLEQRGLFSVRCCAPATGRGGSVCGNAHLLVAVFFSFVCFSALETL